jgi:hypothetical protein
MKERSLFSTLQRLQVVAVMFSIFSCYLESKFFQPGSAIRVED